jgi:hypothetical protein
VLATQSDNVVALRPGIEGVQTGVVRHFYEQSRVWRIIQDHSLLCVYVREAVVIRSEIRQLLAGMRIKYTMRYEQRGELWVTDLWPMVTVDTRLADRESDDTAWTPDLGAQDPWLERMHYGSLYYDAMSYKGLVSVPDIDQDFFVSRNIYMAAGGLPDVSVRGKPVKVKLMRSPNHFGGYETDQIIFL